MGVSAPSSGGSPSEATIAISEITNMPNWCFNRVQISGEPDDVTALKDFVASDKSPFDFDRIVPSPEYLGVVPESYDPFAWSYEFWGAHSVAFSASLEIEEDWLLEYHFDTKWRPATGIYRSLVERFPKLAISWFYDEPDSELAGYLAPEDVTHEIGEPNVRGLATSTSQNDVLAAERRTPLSPIA